MYIILHITVLLVTTAAHALEFKGPVASWNLELETDNSILLPTFNFSLAKVQYIEKWAWLSVVKFF